jgi:hypothetical protein
MAPSCIGCFAADVGYESFSTEASMLQRWTMSALPPIVLQNSIGFCSGAEFLSFGQVSAL